MNDVNQLISYIEQVREEALQSLSVVDSWSELDKVRVGFLGRKGKLTQILHQISQLSLDVRPLVGQKANALKEELHSLIAEKQREFEKLHMHKKLQDQIDVTLPLTVVPVGSLHPITHVLDEIIDIFLTMGFEVADGPEVETLYYNFDALNIPPQHPARDAHDTFYISDELILRTHTSPVQIRVMERKLPPIYIIIPGKVYRRDQDITHSPIFHQIEVLAVDEGITFAHLKGTIQFFLKEIFSEDIALRFRPSYFPFTEPSAEVDISCLICGGRGCSICKGSGWVEVLGAGMVHERLFELVGYDSGRYQGFAFGLGVERIAMLRYKIDDIKLFFENDINFLRQFQ